MSTNPKSYIRSLVGSGTFTPPATPANPNPQPVSFNGMRVLACQAKAGYSFYIQLQDTQKKGKKTTTTTVARGASTHYDDLASASAAVDAAVVTAQGRGFTAKPKSARGFVRQADTFTLDSLPAPVAAQPAPAPSKSKKS